MTIRVDVDVNNLTPLPHGVRHFLGLFVFQVAVLSENVANRKRATFISFPHLGEHMTIRVDVNVNNLTPFTHGVRHFLGSFYISSSSTI